MLFLEIVLTHCQKLKKKIKKIAIIALPIIFLVLISLITFNANHIKYTLTDDASAYYVSDCGNSVKTAVILKEYKGKPVVGIGVAAFENCRRLTSVTIPDSVTSIGSSAFKDCISLTTIKYRGTDKQWKKITKYLGWDNNTGNYTITYNYNGE